MSLSDIITAEITASGPMPLLRYMDLCLSHYYATRDPLGTPTETGGDFTTAPEISQMFGELIGLWAVDSWQQLGRPAPFTLAELGPGRGTLMADALRAAAQVAPDFIAAAQIHLVETSPALRAKQAEKLATYNPTWHETIDSLPPLPALIIANEFFDALPIAQVRRSADGWLQKAVTLNGEALIFTEIPVTDMPADIAARLAEGWLEYSLPARTVMQTLSAHIATHGGALLAIDYGYDDLAHVKNCDTLQALQKHAPVDPLDDPGSADLTAHVDFTALATIAKQSGLAAATVTQASFLTALGIAARAEKLGQPAELHRLTIDMGTLFKVLLVA